MAREIDPKDTTRAMAFELWMKAPNPMVTFFKTLDITNLIKVSGKKKLKFNMLLDFCIGKAAVAVKESAPSNSTTVFPFTVAFTAWILFTAGAFSRAASLASSRSTSACLAANSSSEPQPVNASSITTASNNAINFFIMFLLTSCLSFSAERSP